ncbi:hypothetical protein Y032_0644g1070 [Ancylostoma ceylanicum]|uniref:Uncharacterized protein n=1 Tax=Ancylostoma ceylanicum TaxID=53326 RepID=A0A016WKY3_9BILA|nr:hypothetical protein Y032_0644g1070 [Ancylostoma ceylanicum]
MVVTGTEKDKYRYRGSTWYVIRNDDDELNLNYADSHNLVTIHKKFRESPTSYPSTVPMRRPDIVLVRDHDQMLITNPNIIPYDSATSSTCQHSENHVTRRDA